MERADRLEGDRLGAEGVLAKEDDKMNAKTSGPLECKAYHTGISRPGLIENSQVDKEAMMVRVFAPPLVGTLGRGHFKEFPSLSWGCWNGHSTREGGLCFDP
jgi:hypothetical protein